MANKFILKFKNKRLILGQKTIVMGVLNVTPDSFSDGGLYYGNAEKAVNRAYQMVNEGADIIDIGGESTRPGSCGISEKEEIDRIIPVIKGIRKSRNKCFISVDTYKEEVAGKALIEGADIINALSGEDYKHKIFAAAKEFKCPIILYHIRGTPKNMQKGEIRYKDVVRDIVQHFIKRIEFGVEMGLNRNQFLVDPGIGFGKTVEQNLEIVRKLKDLSVLKTPVVIGISRKSHLGKILQDELKLPSTPSPTDRLEASLAETAIAVLNGAHIIRTHDVVQTKKFLAALDKLK